MDGVLLVSHSKKITDGLKEMIEEMIGSDSQLPLYSLGGTEDGRLGTDAVRIMQAIEECHESDNIYIFCDIGSAIMSAETALDMVSDSLHEKIILVDGPLVEGAFAAAIQVSVGQSKDLVMQELSNL